MIPDNLRKFSELKRHNLRVFTRDLPGKIYGLYFVVYRGEVVYAGRSTNLVARLRSHKKKRPYDTIFYIEMERGKMYSAERIYVRHLRPIRNRISYLNPRKKSARVQKPYVVARREPVMDIWGEPFLVPLSQVDEVLRRSMRRYQ